MAGKAERAHSYTGDYGQYGYVTPFDLYVGERLRAARGAISQRELSKRTGMAQGRISEYETGHKSITLSSLYLLSVTLGVEIRDLIPSTREMVVNELLRDENLRVSRSHRRRRSAARTGKGSASK